MMKRNRWFAPLVIGVLLQACGSAGGSPNSAPGVSDSVIKLGMITDLTGPIAFLGQEISAGARLYFDHVNRNGGVHGRRIELLVEDDGYQPPRSVAAFRKLVDRDNVFAFMGNLGTATVMATRPMIEREQIPLVFPATYASVIFEPPSHYIFGQDPSYPMTSWMMLDYALRTGEREDMRIGVIYQDDDMGSDALRGLHEAAEYYGVEIVAEEAHRRGAVEFGSQVLNLRRAGVTHVILWTILRESAAILKEAQAINWAPQFIGWFGFADDRIVELAGSAAKNLVLMSLFDSQSESPHVREYFDLVAEFDPDRRIGAFHASGFTAAQTVVEALRRAGRDLTREGLIAAVESFDHWNQNAWEQPITYGPGVRGGRVARTFFAKPDLDAGRLVRVSEDIVFQMPTLDAATTDQGSDGAP